MTQLILIIFFTLLAFIFGWKYPVLFIIAAVVDIWSGLNLGQTFDFYGMAVVALGVIEAILGLAEMVT